MHEEYIGIYNPKKMDIQKNSIMKPNKYSNKKEINNKKYIIKLESKK